MFIYRNYISSGYIFQYKKESAAGRQHFLKFYCSFIQPGASLWGFQYLEFYTPT